MAFLSRPFLAAAALIWVLRGKKVRGWNGLSYAASSHPRAYSNWLRYAEPAIVRDYCSADRPQHSLRMGALILVDPAQDRAALAASRDSLVATFGSAIRIWTDIRGAAGCESCGPAMKDCLAEIGKVGGIDWLLPIKAGDRVGKALASVLESRHFSENTEIVFWDEDRLIDGKRSAPLVKPAWDAILFRAYDGVSGSCMIRTSAVALAAEQMDPIATGCEAIAELTTKLALAAGQKVPEHIPLILTHRAEGVPFVDAVSRDRMLPPLEREDFSPLLGLVSIIIPTRDRADLLTSCLASLDLLPALPPHEIVIVDNGSTESATLDLFMRLEKTGQARVVHRPGDFNFAALANAGVAEAKGKFVCLLNNDVQALNGDWLSAMVAYAQRRDVGAVGARLLYPDGSLQHAGVALGIGGAAGHVEKGVFPEADIEGPWYAFDRQVSAVTGACLMVARDKFLAVEGMDEKTFSIDFNDVDLCMRLNHRGWQSIYCAEATLVHHESKSRGTRRRGRDLVRFNEELAALKARWQTDGFQDPHYSPLFRRFSERCQLAF